MTLVITEEAVENGSFCFHQPLRLRNQRFRGWNWDKRKEKFTGFGQGEWTLTQEPSGNLSPAESRMPKWLIIYLKSF